MMEACAFYNHIAEAIVIAAISSDRNDGRRIAMQLTPDDFHDINHRRIFTGLKGKPLDFIITDFYVYWTRVTFFWVGKYIGLI